MLLKDIDTSKFLVNPKNPEFKQEMIKLSNVFDFSWGGPNRLKAVSHTKALTYIALVYDKNSYFRKDIKKYLQRKYMAGEVAGFVIKEDGTFKEGAVENALIGENEYFNKAVIQYAVLQYDIEYAKLVVYELNLHKLLLEAMNAWDKKGDAQKQIETLSSEIAALELKIFGGEETLTARKALYEGTARTRVKLRPEDVQKTSKIRALQDWSPYGKDYIPEMIKFVGDKTPKPNAQIQSGR